MGNSTITRGTWPSTRLKQGYPFIVRKDVGIWVSSIPGCQSVLKSGGGDIVSHNIFGEGPGSYTVQYLSVMLIEMVKYMRGHLIWCPPTFEMGLGHGSLLLFFNEGVLICE